MLLTGQKAVVLAEDMYEDLELWYPVLRLREEGAQVVIVGTGSSASYTGLKGYPLTVEATIDQVSAEEVDAVIVPGAGLIYIGKHFAGLVLVGIVMVGYIPVFFPGIFVQPTGWIALPSDALLRFIAIIIAIIAYIVSFTAIKEYHAH